MKEWKNTIFLKRIIPSIVVDFNKVKSMHEKNVSQFTYNSKYTDAWDVRFKQIVETCILEGIPYIKFDCGPLWSGVMVLDHDTGDLYIFFNEKRFRDLIKSNDEYKTHYFKQLLLFNDDLNNLGEHQLDLLSDNQESEKRLKFARELLGDNFESINRVIPVTFELSGIKTVGVTEYLCNGYGDIIYAEDIFDLLQSETSQIEINADHPIEKKIVSLKKDVYKKSESIPEIKVDKSTKDK